VLDGADPTKESGEKRFIEEIWSNSGVLSSLEHEQAVGAGSTDTKLSSAEQYALHVAGTAAKRLQESIRAAQSVSIGTVTWTGQNGSAGHPQRASASNLLGRFKNRAGGSQGGNSFVARDYGATGHVGSLRSQMLEFFRTNNGVVTTKQIGSWCSSVGINQRDRKRALEMKATLRKIASLNKLTHSWELTEKFK
jgi:DNA excision repair protein ERCC-6